MTTSTPYNGRIPTDPTQLVALLLLAAAVIGQLTTEQAAAMAELVAPVLLWFLRERPR